MTSAPAPTSQPPQQIDFRHPESALRAPIAHVWLWCVALAGLAFDLWTKDWAFRTLDPMQSRPWIPNVLEFQLSLNAGALFGIGSGKGTLFIIASFAALVFVLYLFSGTARDQRVLHVALALILAGATGNLYDRATHEYDRVVEQGAERAHIGAVLSGVDEEIFTFRPWYQKNGVMTFARGELAEPVQKVGVVRDFLHFVPKFNDKALWPWVFNVADALLVAGVALLLIGYWRCARRDAAQAREQTEPRP